MDPIRMFELARALAEAKSRCDLPAAMRLLHPDMRLETPAFGTDARGLAQNERVLRRFFASFEDDLIASERFFFDLSSLCAQSGVSTDAIRRTLFGASDGS